ncbi:MAG: CBS domain-containing protein [Rhodobacteraceae bacterium]|nr:CBS domain-containing protein [Paracoccaceae bacterium]
MTALALVSDYMSRDLITLSPDQEINRAAKILLDGNISGAPVVGPDGRLVGVLSKKDCLRAALEASYYRDWGRAVANYMSTPAETLDPSLDIVTACQAFLDSTYRRFPVVGGDRLVGQISRADILRAMSDNWG